MSTENVILVKDNIQVYESDIQVLCDEYIESLPNADMIYKTAVYNGLLDYIYKHLLHNVITNDNGITSRSYDYHVLNDIFYNIYLPLCYRYNKTPTVLQFCTLCRIDNRNISDVKIGTYRNNGAKVNTENQRTVAKWYSACESALYNRAIEDNSIGAIFGLKAAHGWRDNQTITIEQSAALPHETPEQIAAKYSDIERPELPDLN